MIFRVAVQRPERKKECAAVESRMPRLFCPAFEKRKVEISPLRIQARGEKKG